MFQAPTKDEARARIAALVENFERQLPDYHRGSYNETQTRRDFIDPFFQALGWDIDNRSGAAEAYREVIHEDKVKVGQATKAPDYSFRLPGGQRLFFVEAKKPSVKIKEEILPAYQVRRYGWSAKLALSILTDFEELAVYDCTLQPAPTDKAAKGRLKYLTFREYAAEFDFLWDTFSKESVLRGGLDRFVATGSGKRGQQTVDAAFLTTLEAMRAELAQGLATRNRHLDADELRFLVQMLLDRIIFLRIAEDRGIEPYADLQAVARVKKKDEVYAGLLDRFKAAAARYNSGLFDLEKDALSAVVRLDNAVLAPLLQRLYYPESPYEFSVIGAEILGSAYERFLGKVIALEPGRVVRIEDKPEVRKAGGVFYTPAYIVNYIVAATLGPRCTGRTPQDVARLRVLDPACGSGSFLLGAYQYLLDWHLAYYQAHPTAALPPVPVAAGKAGGKAPPRRMAPLTPDGRLSSPVKKAILLNNIYGVDLDGQAVEVTKLSLLLKCLEGETSASIQQALGLERVLPTIDQNIRVGNSLVETDFYDGEIDFAPGTEKAVKPFGWHDEFAAVFKQGGFDVVIGNPPYFRVEAERPESAYYRKTYKTPEFKLDIFTLFFEKFIQQGFDKLAFIVPNTLLTNATDKKLRELILAKCSIDEIVNYKVRVFDQAVVHTMIIILDSNPSNQQVKITQVEETGTKSFEATKSDFKNNDYVAFDIRMFGDEKELFEKIKAASWRLDEVCEVKQAIKSGDDKSLIHNGPPQYKNFKPIVGGKEIGRYVVKFNNRYIDYGSHLACPRNPRIFEASEKILVRETGKDIIAAFDTSQLYVMSSLYCVLALPETLVSLKFILGVVNSSMSQFYMQRLCFDNSSGAFVKARIFHYQSLPIPKLNLKIPADKKKHDDVVNLVEQLLTGYAALPTHTLAAAKEQAQAKLRHLERRLDGLVYDLYQLTEEERAHVAGGGAG